ERRALELRREGAVGELEQLAVIAKDVVDALVVAGERVVPRHTVDGVGGEKRSEGVHVAFAEGLVALTDEFLVGVCHFLLLCSPSYDWRYRGPEQRSPTRPMHERSPTRDG